MRATFAFALVIVLAFGVVQPVWVVGQPEKVTFCHVSDDDPPVAITMTDFPEVAAENHLKNHPYDHYGPCAPPVANNDSVEIDQGATIVIDVAANDTDGNGLDLESISIKSGPYLGSLQVNTDGTVTYTNTNSGSTQDEFTYTIKDVTQAESNEASVEIFIQPSCEPIYFPDINLEQAIREVLEKPTGDITTCDALEINFLLAIGRGISDLQGIQYLSNLVFLLLPSNEISDLSPISELTNLRYLWVHGNNISDISPLSNLTNLDRLQMGANNISDLSPLANLKNLTVLEARMNNISDISVLSGLTRLEQVTLGFNNISDISPLANLTQLISVSLQLNNISDISALGGLTHLIELVIYDNNISDIGALSGLTNLILLYIGENNISDISALAGLTQLVELDVAYNNISDIGALSGLTQLAYLDLSSDYVSDISSLVANTGIGSGDRLDLWDNPLSDQALLDVEILRGRGVNVYF